MWVFLCEYKYLFIIIFVYWKCYIGIGDYMFVFISNGCDILVRVFDVGSNWFYSIIKIFLYIFCIL